jgi:predicted RNA-binding protein YlqC (UPF0109 family)
MIEKEFIIYIVKQLVDNPDAVKCERIIDDRGILLKLTVAAEDLGRVIGKHGATAQSLRNMLRALGTKNNDHYNLKIIDVDRPESADAVASADSDSPNGREKLKNLDKTEDSKAEETEIDKVVENSATETVDKIDDERKKIRESLADLDDLDI